MKFRKSIVLFIFIFLFSGYQLNANTPDLIGEQRLIVGSHKREDDVGNKYYYSTFADIPELGDFKVYYKNNQTYKIKYEGEVEEETLNFITIDKNINGIEKQTVVFCIEPNEMAVWIDDTNPNNSHYQNLTQSEQQKVSKILSTVTNLFSTTGNYDYLSSGQLLVWEAIGAQLLEVPKSIQSELTKTREIVKEYNLKPSFLNEDTDFELKYNDKNMKYEITLEDTNHILDKHFKKEIIGKYGQFTIEDGPKKDDLYIWSKDYTNLSKTIHAAYDEMPNIKGQRAGIKYMTEPTFINSGQDLISGISYTTKIQFKLHIKEAKGEAKLKKCGYKEEQCIPLEGVKFGLYNELGDLKEQKTTDANGEIIFNNLSLGKYYVKEIYAPKQYEINDKKYEFEISSDNEVVPINNNEPIENKLITGTVSLKKVGIKENSNDTLFPLEGVEFTIYQDENENSILDEEDVEVQKLITNDLGEIHSKKLKYGKYIIKETKALPGYINSGYKEDFFIHNNSQNIELLGGMDLVNDIKRGTIDLLKHGEKWCVKNNCQSIPLEGVKFIIYKDENNSQTIDGVDVAIETLITDEDGYAKSQDLIFGNYIIKEVSSQLGYELLEEEYPFKITGEKNIHLNEGRPIINKLKTKEIKVNKKDQFGETISNVQFAIYSDTDHNAKLSSSDILLQTITTNSQGSAKSRELPYGDYLLVEKSTPPGYEIKLEPISFIVNDVTYNQHLTFEIENSIITENLKIIKKDDESRGVLEGVEFELYKDDNNSNKIEVDDTKIGNYKTDINGEINIKDIVYGKYLLKEIKPKDGYYLNKQIYKINIDGSKKEYVYEVYNKKIVKEVVEHLVNTSVGNKYYIKKFLLLFLILLTIIVFFKKSRKDKNYI